jgi:hypothetical protein
MGEGQDEGVLITRLNSPSPSYSSPTRGEESGRKGGFSFILIIIPLNPENG